MKNGFSLVELLIVVTVIGILAAIAMPRFQDARIRAKVAQSQANLKALDSAIQQMQFDRDAMLVDMNDGANEWGQNRIDTIFFGVGKGNFPERNFLSVLAPLTTPVSYISNIPNDPFLYRFIKAHFIEEDERKGNILSILHYVYEDNDPQGPSADYFSWQVFRRMDSHSFNPDLIPELNPDILIHLNENEYMVWGYGPKQRYISNVQGDIPVYGYVPVVYNVTNGAFSDGILILVSGEGVLQ